MKLGMPTLIECKSVEENVELCLQLGLDFIELNMNLPICFPENLSYERLQRLKRKHQLQFTIHLPEEIDLSSPHHSIRKGHLKRCKETIRWAKSAGISLINMHIHNGTYFTLPEQKLWVNEVYEQEFVENLCAAYAELYAYAHLYDVMLCIENATNFQLPFIQKGLQLLAQQEGFFLTWDVGHDARTGYEEMQVIQPYMDRVRHMHLHDVKLDKLQQAELGFVLDHQPLYTGSVPLDDRIQFAQEREISVVIEVKTAEFLQQSIQQLHSRKIRDNLEK